MLIKICMLSKLVMIIQFMFKLEHIKIMYKKGYVTGK